MKPQQKVVFDELTAMQHFLNEHAKTMAPVNQSSVRAALDDLLRTLAAQETVQRTATLRLPSRRERLRELRLSLLAAHLRPIITFARKHASRAPMLGCLRMPARNLSTDELLTSAMAIEELVDEHQVLFLNEAFPADFLEQLGRACETVRAAASARNESLYAIEIAREEIKQLISRGRSVGRVLDTLVLEKLEGNPRLAAEWRAITAATPQER